MKRRPGHPIGPSITIGSSMTRSSQPGLYYPPEQRKIKMKLSLRERFRNWLMRDDDDDGVEIYIPDEAENDEFHIDHESAFHFSVVPADGGKIVKISYYDKGRDRNVTKLHIITPDEKLEEALAHIFQIEVLSR